MDIDEMRIFMTCNHCLRRFGLLHAGNGPMICCECVHIWRAWLALENRGANQHNHYAQESLDQHAGGKWCEGAIIMDDPAAPTEPLLLTLA